MICQKEVEDKQVAFYKDQFLKVENTGEAFQEAWSGEFMKRLNRTGAILSVHFVKTCKDKIKTALQEYSL